MVDKFSVDPIPTSDSLETGKELIKAYWERPEKFDGLIPPEPEIPEGFVIDGYPDEKIKDIIKDFL